MSKIDTIIDGAIYVVNSFDGISDWEDEYMFIGHATYVYNEIVKHQNVLHETDKPYLLGTFFSYIVEYINSKKNPTINPYKRVCIENALYCYMRCINENEMVSRKQAGAMRMLLLMCENSYSLFDIAFALNNKYPHFDIIVETKALLRKVEAHCYNLYRDDVNHYVLDNKRMVRLSECVEKTDNPKRRFYLEETKFSWECMFDLLKIELEYPTNEYRLSFMTEDDLE